MSQFVDSQASGAVAGYALINLKTGAALSCDSFLELSATSGGDVLSNPVEQGGFASYNKTQSPGEYRVLLGWSSDNPAQEQALKTLEELKRSTDKIGLVTPAAYYPDLTLRSFSYTRQQAAGASLLSAELDLVEVREVRTQVTTTAISRRAAKNPGSVSNEDVGLAKTESSWLYMLTGKKFDLSGVVGK